MKVFIMKNVRIFRFCSTIFLIFFLPHQLFAEGVTVSAVYKVQFGGVDLGKFRFQSVVQNNNYKITGRTKLKLLNGLAMDWRMNIHSKGEVTHAGPQPMNFGYSFRNKKGKQKKRNVTFNQLPNGDLEVLPKPKVRKGHVPLQQVHLKNVYDPMSALIKLTLSEGEALDRRICNKTMRLFDGKERYDIAFKYKSVKVAEIGHKKLSKAKSYVCSLKYIPVSGHKQSDKTKKYMANAEAIEVWFAPSEKAGIYIPHMINVPTPFGANTTIKVRSFTVQKGGGKPVNLVR